MKKLIVAFLSISIIASGCTTHPSRIQPAYTSPIQYQPLSCEQLQEESVRIHSNIKPMRDKLAWGSTRDSINEALGFLLFFPLAIMPLFSQEKKLEPQYASLLGELTAVKQTSESKNCVASIEYPGENKPELSNEEKLKQALAEKRKTYAEAHK